MVLELLLRGASPAVLWEGWYDPDREIIRNTLGQLSQVSGRESDLGRWQLRTGVWAVWVTVGLPGILRMSYCHDPKISRG